MVEFLKIPQFQRLGGKIPKGALLVGPLERENFVSESDSRRVNLLFFSISGSDLWKCW